MFCDISINIIPLFDILANLKEMFGSKGRSARQNVVWTVEDHVLKMIGHMNELEILGAYTNAETQVDMVLSSLSDSFRQFCLIIE